MEICIDLSNDMALAVTNPGRGNWISRPILWGHELIGFNQENAIYVTLTYLIDGTVMGHVVVNFVNDIPKCYDIKVDGDDLECMSQEVADRINNVIQKHFPD